MSLPRPLTFASRAWRRLAAAWALVAVFGVGLAPSISQWVLSQGGPGSVASLCGEGAWPPGLAPLLAAAPLGKGGARPGGQAPVADAACALCVLAHAAPLVGTPSATVAVVVPGRPVQVAAAVPTGRPDLPRPPALARAPPRTPIA